MKQSSLVLSLILLCALPAFAAPLSRSIEYDRLLMHAHNAVTRGDYGAAANDYERAAKLDVGPPESFYLDYASTLGAMGKWKNAKAVLETYFRRFAKQGEWYDLALRHYVETTDRVAERSQERVRPHLVGVIEAPPNAPAPRRTALLDASPAARNAAPSTLPPMPVTQGEPSPGISALQGMLGLYSGENKDADESSRGPSCTATPTPARAHPASDCFYGFHRSMSLNAVDGSAVVGFVKVDYVREHRPASAGERKGSIYTRMEYYLAIRMWMTPGGLIQGQQRGLCEFVVDTQTCAPAPPQAMTPLRSKATSGGLGVESDKGGGLRIYTKVRGLPERVRPDVVKIVPALVGFGGTESDMPANEPAATPSLGDTADAEDDDAASAGTRIGV